MMVHAELSTPGRHRTNLAFSFLSRIVLFVLFSLFLMTCSEEAEGEMITVDTEGNGDFLSIQDALDSSQEGDEIRVFSGTYHEAILVTKNITLTGNGSTETFIEAGDVDAVTIDNATVNLSGFGISGIGNENRHHGIHTQFVQIHIMDIVCHGNRSITIIASQDSLLENVSFLNHSGLFGIHIEGGQHLTVRNVTIEGGDIGIHIRNSEQITIENSSISGATTGLHVENSEWTIFMNNTIVGNGGSGIIVDWGSEFTSIAYNIVSRNQDGISILIPVEPYDGAPDPTWTFIQECEVSNNTRYGIHLRNSTGNSIRRSNITMNAIGILVEDSNNQSSVLQCNFEDNRDAAISLSSPSAVEFRAMNNYWGDPGGPFHALTNPDGIGDSIEGNVNFTSWSATPLDISDFTAPTAPTNLTIHGPTYFDPDTNFTYLIPEENYTVTFNGPTLATDPDLYRIYFNVAYTESYPIENFTDGNYSRSWTPSVVTE